MLNNAFWMPYTSNIDNIDATCLSPLNPVGVKDLESDTKGDRTH